MKPTAWVASLLSFVLTLEGCSVAIAMKDRIGPNPDRDFKERGSRAEVEEKLGEPISTERLVDGNVRAVYQYTARVSKETNGTSSAGDSNLGVAGMLLLLEIASYGLIELVFMPIAYFSKPKHTYQKVYVYNSDGMIVDSSLECIQSQPTQYAENWCSRKPAERTVAEAVTPVPEDKPPAPPSEPAP